MLRLALGEDTHLEPLEAAHAAPLFDHVRACRADLRRWLSWPAQLDTLEKFQSRVALLLRLGAQGEALTCVVCVRGAPVGMAGLQDLEPANLAGALGYWLAPVARGRGLVTRACRALVTHAFDAHALQRVVVRCATDNHASRRVPERLGFRYEGTHRACELLVDRFVDHAVYAMLAEHWAATCALVARSPVRAVAPADAPWLATLPGASSARMVDAADVALAVPERGVIAVAVRGDVADVVRLDVAPGPDASTVAARLLGAAADALRRRGVTVWTVADVVAREHADALRRLGLRAVRDALWVGGLA